ncbi:cation transporter, partial [Candidatus Woesearchaeota archaeon]|nr:cation transporter [Candidatus Woesearchaeota archaeon]
SALKTISKQDFIGLNREVFAKMKKIKIKTKGMHCASCEVLLKSVLEELEGVNDAKASCKTGIISVDFDEDKVNEKEIIELIKLEGYKIK